jgi:hypothetical protein
LVEDGVGGRPLAAYIEQHVLALPRSLIAHKRRTI